MTPMLCAPLLVTLGLVATLGCGGDPCVSACEAHKACAGARQDDCPVVCDAERTSAERANCVDEHDAMFECVARNEARVCNENVYTTVCAPQSGAYAACLVGAQGRVGDPPE